MSISLHLKPNNDTKYMNGFLHIFPQGTWKSYFELRMLPEMKFIYYILILLLVRKGSVRGHSPPF